MTKSTLQQDQSIIETSLDKALGERYLSYALSTIMARSLPDVRDGLKPVHRRILYAMRESGNTPDKSFRKSASAVGYVMMKYHPHGDLAIYDAMVRMAQDFSTRYLLVQGQGNFGSIDGDNAAAMRYTEARLSPVAMDLLEGIYEDAVDFGESYNGEAKEPKVLPARFPNLLANGSSGIAVGMATNIPPHNLEEICNALLHLIKTPNASIETLVKHMAGPDFPTGGVIVEPRENLLKAYETGRGSIRLRARYEVETLPQGQYQLVVTEIPYQVQKSRLIERIADLWSLKKLPLLADIRDESAADIRIVLVPKNRTVDPAVLMESLYRTTELETRFNLNMNVLDHGRIPKVMNLRDVLQAFLNHRRVVLCRRTQYRLDEIERRLEILRGFMIVFLNVDEVIRIIRFEDQPKEQLIARFVLTELQADAILNMRLKSLRKLEEMQIKQELDSLETEKQGLQALLASEEQQWQTIADDIRDLKKAYGAKTAMGARRTSFADAPDIQDVPLEAIIEKEPVTVVCSVNNWIRILKGHTIKEEDLKFKEGDEGRFILQGETTDKLLIFDSTGKFFTVGVDKLPGGRGHGEPINLMVDLAPGASIVTMLLYRPSRDQDQQAIVASTEGHGFIVSLKNVLAQTKNGKQILNLEASKKALCCVPIQGDHIAIVGNNRKLLVYPVQEIPEMNRGRGVTLQKYREGHLSDLTTFVLAEGLSWPLGERMRTETNLLPWLGRRGQIGKQPPVGFPKNNKFNIKNS
jgi:DNA topoisomerase IV subunit A (EC 5.99.1.3)